MKVAVVDQNKQPLAPCHPAMARRLLSTGKAAVLKRFPFTLILKREIENPTLPDLRLKIDPGAKTTGIAIVNQATGEVIFAAELEHRSQAIKKKLDERRSLRRNRRSRKTRYRKARFLNRTKPEGWLAPSLKSRVCHTETWVKRLSKVYPIAGVALELVKFDMQLMQNAEISGVAYQQGELQGYQVREYLLEKFGRQCIYCKKENVPLQVEHIIPKSRNGSNRVSNLTLACVSCNLKKNTQTAAEFGFPQVQQQAKQPLKDAAAVNTTRWALLNALKFHGFEVETGSGALTKYNRTQRKLPKTHWLDAVCVGASTPETINIAGVKVWTIKAVGHNSRQMCRMDQCGFPRTAAKALRTVKGFRTGDLVEAVVLSGKKQGRYVGKVAVRSSGSFNIVTKQGTVQGVSHRYCRLLQRADGYLSGAIESAFSLSAADKLSKFLST